MMLKNKISQIWQHPYPFLFSQKRDIYIALFSGIIGSIINYWRLSDDFVSATLSISKLPISISVGCIIASIVFMSIHFVPQLLYKDNYKEYWSIGKEVTVLLCLLSAIAICNYIFFLSIAESPRYFLSLYFIFKVILYAYSAGSILIILVTWINYTLILRINLKQVKEQNKQLKAIVRQESSTTISIPTSNKSEHIITDPNTLLFVRSSGNYIETFSEEKGKIKKHIYRISIQEMENALKDYSLIIRVHRSYLVNLLRIKNTYGNARNYTLFFEDTEETVPVARSRFSAFNTLLQSITN